MCNQSVGLIASIIEKAGIPTVALSLLREVAEKVKPPRTLFVPFKFGYPLGEPDRPEVQHRIIAGRPRIATNIRPAARLERLRAMMSAPRLATTRQGNPRTIA